MAEISTLLIRHRRLIEIGFWLVYLCTNAVVEAWSVITEHARISRPLDPWEPFVWEFSSVLLIGALVIVVARLNREFRFRADSWVRPLLVHIVATVPFSLIHVGGMVALRKMAYSLVGRSYEFGNLVVEFPYEFRKDFVTYWFVIGIIYLWQHIRFLSAAQPVLSEDATAPLRRLVAKKRGKEFLINTSDVNWIEASGNYANLHHPDGVFPVRVSMTDLQHRLDGGQFARVHRSYIVNLDKIGEIEPTDGGDYLIHMKDGVTVRFSRRYRAKLRGKLEQ